jgi:selenocysteine-specific elongation factor
MESNLLERVSKLEENIDPSKIMNINVGILGHIDSGKTSLAKKISTVASTAAFDKNPQSKERGITLDLGFSAFYILTPSFLKEKFPDNERLNNSDYLQLTLVDCPGHASLIKTVIAGASIIDTIVLVVDAIKGIQTQTTECLVLAQILTEKIIVALNKSDMINTNEELEAKILKLRTAFGMTKFGKDLPLIPVSASPKSDKSEFLNYDKQIDELILAIINSINFDKKIVLQNKKDFLFSIDHCFNIKNKGTIVTGTILKGKVSINDELYFPELCEKKIVKEMQMFKKSIQKAFQGDRVGMLIKNLDSTKIERSIACNEGYVNSIDGGLFLLKKVKFYKGEIKSNQKFYIIIGNQGVMAKCFFFNKSCTLNKDLINDHSSLFETSVNLKNVYNSEFDNEETLESKEFYTFALLKFDQKMLIPPEMIALGSKIDFDVSHKSNRIAFYGKLIDTQCEDKLKIFKMKNKVGSILRMVDDKTAIVKNLFKKDSNIDDFIGKHVSISESEGKIEGIILTKFGQSGKVKVEFNTNIKDLKLKNTVGEEIDFNFFSICLEYKKYVKFNK